MKNSEIKEKAVALGAEVCGIAGIESFAKAPAGFHPRDILPGAKCVIVFGKQFSKSVFAVKTNAPYMLVRNKLLELVDEISVQLSYALESEGYTAVPIPSSEPYEYWDAQRRHGRGILSLKHAAQLAGLGYLGKNTLLINEKYGNRLWIGAVIADVQLAADPPNEGSCPDACRICLDACPQSALDAITVDQMKCREICFSSTEGGGGLYACNLCRRECPTSKV